MWGCFHSSMENSGPFLFMIIIIYKKAKPFVLSRRYIIPNKKFKEIVLIFFHTGR